MIDSVSTGSDGGGDTALGGRGARERRDAGLWYDANYDEGLAAATLRAKDLAFDYNHARPSDEAARARILRELIGNLGEHVTIHSPFYVDYGTTSLSGTGRSSTTAPTSWTGQPSPSGATALSGQASVPTRRSIPLTSNSAGWASSARFLSVSVTTAGSARTSR